MNKVRACGGVGGEGQVNEGASFSLSLATGIQATELSEFPWALLPHVALIFNLAVCYG